IEASLVFPAEDTNGLEQAQCSKSIGVGRIFRRLERYLHMRLRREIVDLIRLRFLHNADDGSRVGEIALVQMEGTTLLGRLMKRVVDATVIEGCGPALDPMDDGSLGKKEISEVGAVLPGHAGNEGDFTR